MATAEDVASRRLKELRKSKPYMNFEDDYMDTEEGVRGLIRAISADESIEGLDFIEPEGLWSDPDVIEEYRETLEEGYRVTVIVPTEELDAARAMLSEVVGHNLVVLGYDEAGHAT